MRRLAAVITTIASIGCNPISEEAVIETAGSTPDGPADAAVESISDASVEDAFSENTSDSGNDIVCEPDASTMDDCASDDDCGEGRYCTEIVRGGRRVCARI